MEEPRSLDSIAVVGDSAMCTGFRLAGVQNVFTVATDDEGEKTLERLMAEPGVGILVAQERLLENCDWRLKKRIEAAAKPVVVTVPGIEGPAEQSESLAALVKRALGFDLMAKKKEDKP